MNLHDLSPSDGSKKEKKRPGRGRGSSHGESCGRGIKGQKKRSKVPLYFEGGQTPLYRRVPKRGFNRHQRRTVQELNVKALNRFEEGRELTPDDLREAGLVTGDDPIKLLGKGRLDVSVTVRVHDVSSGAREKVQEAGGSVELISGSKDA